MSGRNMLATLCNTITSMKPKNICWYFTVFYTSCKKCEHFKEACTWSIWYKAWSHSHQWCVQEVQVTILHSTHGVAQYHESFSLFCRYYLRGRKISTLRSVRSTIRFTNEAEAKFINRLGYDPTWGTPSMYSSDLTCIMRVLISLRELPAIRKQQVPSHPERSIVRRFSSHKITPLRKYK